jgi:DNA polymerase-3 subunit epsilon
MMDKIYAIVDIETTGGQAQIHAITEIAIVIYDGENIINKYQTLINPEQEIPSFIQSLTGISNEMVAQAPYFSQVARDVYTILNGKIFVAHNVSFDYSFVSLHLRKYGYILDSEKLCSIKLARKVMPGLPSYSLGKICDHFQISINGRHRAMGDALATTTLFGMILSKSIDQ